MNKLADNTFLDQLRRGEKEAINLLYEVAYESCSNFVTNNSGTRDDARDNFQESLIVLFRKVREPDFQLTSTIKTYLFSVNRFVWLRSLEKRKKGGLSLVIDDNPDQEYVIVSQDELAKKTETDRKHDFIKESLENLKEDCKKLLMSFYFKKKSLREIAADFDYTEKFAKVKKGRCMNSLKKKVREGYREEGN